MTPRFVPSGLISICLPYWNRQQALDRFFATYEAFFGPLADSGLEFVVADDGSDPEATVPAGVQVVRLPRKSGALNPCVPINRAVAAAKGDIIVLTNPEVLPESANVLWEMVLALTTPQTYVMARCRDVRTGRWLAGPDVDYTSGGREAVPPGAHYHFFALLRRGLWDKVGGFDEGYRHGQACDDNDWLWRLAEAGARWRTTQGVVLHTPIARVAWHLPHNAPLFRAKWPPERQAAVLKRRKERGLDA